MTVYPWVVTERRRKLLKEFGEIARREGKDVSELLEITVEEYIRKHQKTHNPQTAIDDFKDPAFRALPNLWTIEGPGDLKELSSETLREILSTVDRVGYMARKRLEARGER